MDNNVESLTFSHPVPRHPVFARDRLAAKKMRRKVFWSQCLVCECEREFSTVSANCLTCSEKPRIAARLLNKRSYPDKCTIHGETEHSVLRGICLTCFNTNGDPRVDPDSRATPRRISRRYGLHTYLDECHKHGQTEFSTLHGKCLQCFTTAGVHRRKPITIYDRPLAVGALKSYRCKSPFGYIMIGAKDDNDAWVEAKRSSDRVYRIDLEIWDVELGYYVNANAGDIR